MSSHLLGEIERVCDHLVVIDGGRLIRADTIATFTAKTQTLIVEVDGDAAPLAERLIAGGHTVRSEGHQVLISLENDEPYDAVRDAVVDLGIGLVRLEQRRQNLEDLFRSETSSGEEEAAVAAAV